MNQKEKETQFKKSIISDEDDKVITPEHKKQIQNKNILEQRNRAKLELINKYNMSESEAEETLQNIEKKAKDKKAKKKAYESGKKENVENEESEVKNKKDKSVDELENVLEKTNENKEEKSQIIEKEKPTIKTSKEEKSNHNVDDLISNIIPDYEKEICIEVKDVSLSFEISTEKIDNLKELFIRSLKRNKGTVTKFQALKDISFDIYKGEKIGIIGYNGAGKSTLLNVITGIYPPDKGEVKTYGRISPLLALGAGFDHNYSGRENIYLNGAIMGYSKKFLESKFDEIVEFSELEEFIDFPVKNYSSGMLAKLGFSIATIVEPDILIIDEVLGVGDVNFQKKSSDKIRSLMDAGTTVLLVSHSIPQIRQLCDKAIWIDKGQVREIGEVNDVCNHYLKDAEKATKDQLKDIRFR